MAAPTGRSARLIAALNRTTNAKNSARFGDHPLCGPIREVRVERPRVRRNRLDAHAGLLPGYLGQRAEPRRTSPPFVRTDHRRRQDRLREKLHACGGPESCVITAHDATTGEEIGRRTVPAPGEPGDETWGGVPFEERVHIDSWMPIAASAGPFLFPPATSSVDAHQPADGCSGARPTNHAHPAQPVACSRRAVRRLAPQRSTRSPSPGMIPTEHDAYVTLRSKRWYFQDCCRRSSCIRGVVLSLLAGVEPRLLYPPKQRSRPARGGHLEESR